MFERVLVLETSGKVGQAALAIDSSIVAELRLGEERRRASDLAMVVYKLLKQQGWLARELTDVVVGLGPGSYTGLRVGLASAKALAFATGCRFHGVETFAAMALQASGEAQSISVVSDALQGKLFHRRYVLSTESVLVPLTDFAIVPYDPVDSISLHSTVITGPGAELLKGQPAMRIPLAAPSTASLLAVARRLPWAVTNDLWLAEPYYLRGSSAEEKAKTSSNVVHGAVPVGVNPG